MTTPAAIQASYADYRRVKGRKVLQLVLEVPLEMAPQVHEAFGEPLPDGSTWVAVARIDPNAKHEKKGGKLAQRAGILCSERAFKTFLNEEYTSQVMSVLESGPAEPADLVRALCGVTSRADLDHDATAGIKFVNLEAEYKAWLKVA